MTTTTKHAPGTFCWPELATTNQEGAKKFYSSLFGWTSQDTPIGEGETYTIFQLKGQPAAAVFTMMKDMQKQGVPPHWAAYISVNDADETAKKAETLGGKVIMQPFDVMQHGRMAVIQDPTGAVFSLWQAKEHNGVGIFNEPNALVWTELLTPDPTKAETFYKSLIGWTSETMTMDDPKATQKSGTTTYTLFKRQGGENAAGMMKMPMQGQAPPNWLTYFQVTDTDATVNKAKSLGANVFVPPTDIPNVGRFSVLADPSGAAFAVLQPARQG